MWFTRQPRFEEILTQFEKTHLPTVSDGTRTRYQLDIEKRIRPYFAGRRLDEVAALQIAQFRSELLKTLSPKSVNNCMSVLGLAFGKAVEWGLMEKSPMSLKPLRLPEIKYPWWEKKEYIHRFLAEAKKTECYASFLLALECGLRLGEIVGLGKKDVDLDRRQIHVHQQWLEAQGRLGPTKGRNIRFLTFSRKSDLRDALASAIAKSSHREAIFVTRTGRRIRATKLRCKLLPMLIRRAKVASLRFHDLRHTFASWYMLEHDDIWSLMKILGHEDIQTTQRYAHLSSRHRRPQSLVWKTK